MTTRRAAGVLAALALAATSCSSDPPAEEGDAMTAPPATATSIETAPPATTHPPPVDPPQTPAPTTTAVAPPQTTSVSASPTETWEASHVGLTATPDGTIEVHVHLSAHSESGDETDGEVTAVLALDGTAPACGIEPDTTQAQLDPATHPQAETRTWRAVPLSADVAESDTGQLIVRGALEIVAGDDTATLGFSAAAVACEPEPEPDPEPDPEPETGTSATTPETDDPADDADDETNGDGDDTDGDDTDGDEVPESVEPVESDDGYNPFDLPWPQRCNATWDAWINAVNHWEITVRGIDRERGGLYGIAAALDREEWDEFAAMTREAARLSLEWATSGCLDYDDDEGRISYHAKIREAHGAYTAWVLDYAAAKAGHYCAGAAVRNSRYGC